MKKVPLRDPKRDKQLIKDYNAGMPLYELGGKYEISSTRIYHILNHYKVQRRTTSKFANKGKSL